MQALQQLDGEGCARMADVLRGLPHETVLVVGQAQSFATQVRGQGRLGSDQGTGRWCMGLGTKGPGAQRRRACRPQPQPNTEVGGEVWGADRFRNPQRPSLMVSKGAGARGRRRWTRTRAAFTLEHATE
jgi:hypothetical protein